MVKIVLDAMGGDNAPNATVLGALKALELNKDVFIKLIGDTDSIKKILKDKTYDNSRLELIHTGEVIEMSEPPVAAIRTKKDSSIVVGL